MQIEDYKMVDMLNKNEIKVVGLKRSGNHAVINWILSQCSGEKLFLNNVAPQKDPFKTCCPDQGSGAIRPDKKERDWLIYSYEDCYLDEINSPKFLKRHEQWLGRSEKNYTLLILRDPFNFFASRMKWVGEEDRITLDFSGTLEKRVLIGLWKSYAREYLRQTHYLNNEVIAVNYNRWFSDKNYRAELAQELGLDFTDKGFAEVPAVGGGSSFDKMEFDGCANEMRVFDRWRAFVSDPTYRSIFTDREIIHLSDEVFGPISDTEKLAEIVNAYKTDELTKITRIKYSVKSSLRWGGRKFLRIIDRGIGEIGLFLKRHYPSAYHLYQVTVKHKRME